MSYKKRRDGDRISWIAIIAAYLLFAPLGVILLLVKLFGTDKLLSLFGVDSDRSTEAEPLLRPNQRVTVDTQMYGSGEASRVREVYAGPVSDSDSRTAGSAAKEAVRNAAQSPTPKKSNARRLKVIGTILAVIGMVLLSDIGPWGFWRAALDDVITAFAFLLGGGAMFVKGHLLSRDMKRYAQYLAIIGDREAMAIDELSRIAGYSKRQTEKDLRQMIENGYFGESAYLNMELGCLFRSNAAELQWRENHQAEMERAERSQSAGTGASKEAEEGYSGILRNIRRANDAIADPVLSAKIDELENITARIFRAVENDPEKAKRIDKFLTYYLPTTQKLLDSYAQFESAGVEGENLSQAKARIASTMDMIIQGFSHQLDELYQADAMDVDSDIRVMETMFRRDNSSFSEDFGMKHPGGNTRSSVAEDFGLGQSVSDENDDNAAVGYYREASERNAVSSTGSSGAGNANAGNSSQGGKRRFGQNFEEDFGMGGAAYQQKPWEQ